MSIDGWSGPTGGSCGDITGPIGATHDTKPANPWRRRTHSAPALAESIGPEQRVIRGFVERYRISMKSNTKSSITLPPEELKLVVSLQARLKAKSKVEIVRRGLRLLQEATDRESL